MGTLGYLILYVVIFVVVRQVIRALMNKRNCKQATDFFDERPYGFECTNGGFQIYRVVHCDYRLCLDNAQYLEGVDSLWKYYYKSFIRYGGTKMLEYVEKTLLVIECWMTLR